MSSVSNAMQKLTKNQIKKLEELIASVKTNWKDYATNKMTYEDWKRVKFECMDKLVDIASMSEWD